MTVYVQNTEVTNTFDFWRNRVNELAHMSSTKAVTVESDPAVGNGGIIGTFFANNIVSEVFTVEDYISVGNSTVNTVISSNTITFSNSVLSTSINSVSGTFNGYISVGTSAANALVNNSVVKISNSTSNVSITIPTTAQYSSGNYYLNANGSWGLVQSAVTTENHSTSGTGLQPFDYFAKGSARTAEYTISTTNLAANGYESSKILIVHDNTNALLTEYSIMFTNNHLCVFTAGCNTTHVILYATPNSTSLSVKYARTLL